MIRFRSFAIGLILAGFSFGAVAQEEKVLNVYNWNDYIAPDTIAKFTTETGIKVNYDNYDTNDLLDSKLKAGKSGYDVVVPSLSPYFANQIKAGLFRPLDKAKIPNLAHLDPAVLKVIAKYDPDNAFGVPYMKSTTVIGYNAEKVRKTFPDAPLESWKMLFDPEVLAKVRSCGVAVLDAPEEVIPAALAYLGKSPASQSLEDLNAAVEVVAKARPFYKYIHSSKYIDDLANGDICVVMGYAGDLVQARNRARESKKRVPVGIALPKEGFAFTLDVMAIPKDAPHPQNAHAFINFIQRPEVIAEITNHIGYANSNLKAESMVEARVKNDPAIYLPEEAKKKIFSVPPASPEYERARTRAWSGVKSRKR